jgi:diguanylate cyclase (GGDEF)-like protein
MNKSSHAIRRARRSLLSCGLLVCTVLAAWWQPAGAAEEHPARELIERGWVLQRNDPEASRVDAEAALALLQRTPHADLEIRARLLLCDYYSERDPTKAHQEANAATALLQNATRPGLRAGVLTCQGEIAETEGNTRQARVMYDQAVSIALNPRDDEMLGLALFSRGYLLGVQGEYAAGLTDLRQARAIFENIAMPHHALTVLNCVAILYNRMGDYAQATHIFTRALKEQRQAGMRREQAVTIHNLARAHENLKHWEAARQAFAEALELSREIRYVRGEAYALRGLAVVAHNQDDPQGALRLLDQASELQRQTPDARLRAQIDLVRGMALHKIGRLYPAIQSLESAVQVFRNGSALHELGATYHELATIHAEMGNWRDAYQHEAQLRATSERLLRNQLDQRFATLKVEFDTASKERENALLLRENEANEKALAQERRVRQLQAAVIALTVLLAILLATLALHQRRSTVRMRALAMTDELTGVPNRRAVLQRLEPLLNRSEAAPCSILIIDIDHFKNINDQHGHAAGDEVLKMLAHKLRAAVQEPAFFGRLGGEEFLVVLPDTGLYDAQQAADELRQVISNVDLSCRCSEGGITASIGVTTSLTPGDTPCTMLRRADSALYAAKRGGRNCVKAEPVISGCKLGSWVMDAEPAVTP